MVQPAFLEENFITNLKSSIKMAFGGFRPRCSFCRNLPPFDPLEDELARDPGPVGGLHSGNTSLVPFHNPTPGPDLVPTLVPTPVPAPVPTPAPAPATTDDLFKQFMKAYLELNQGLRQPPAEREQLLKAKVPELYYGKLHMDCYHFCQQCKDYFETAKAIGANQALFAAFSFCGNISVHWTQYKRRQRDEELTLITWIEFKDFLQKNLEESKSFIDSI